MVDITGDLTNSSRDVHHTLCRFAAWVSAAFDGPVTATTNFATDESSVKCGEGGLCKKELRQLFAKDLSQATDWHVRQRRREGVRRLIGGSPARQIADVPAVRRTVPPQAHGGGTSIGAVLR